MTGAEPLRPHSRSNSALEQMRRELVLAFHILNREGQGNEVAGHVTARLPGAQTFWTNRFRLGFDEANLADLQECDFDINVKTGGEVNQALLFHAAIYEARPDVNAVVHTHPRNAVALASLGQPLLPLDQQAAIFFENIANYNDHEGVVLGKDEAREISKALGNCRGLLMTNHGVVVTGKSVREATVGAIVLEIACEIQIKAMSAGKPVQLSAESANHAKAFLSQDEHIDMRFEYWSRRVLAESPHVARDLA